jgi:hypothetical protein
MKGVLRSGNAIAVKKIFYTHLLGNDNQVKNEILWLTEVRHQNVVQLVGYCVETKSEVVEHSGKHVMAEKPACLLCFEFLCNGSLYKHLSGMLKYNTKIFCLFLFLCKVYLIRSLEHTRKCVIISTATE